MHRRLFIRLIIGLALALSFTVCQAQKTLRFFNWENYIDPSVLEDFEKEFGVEVIEDHYTSNEDLLAKLQAGGGGYDVVVPTDYAVRILIRQGLLAPLNLAHIPNLKHIHARFLHPAYDPEHTYSVPYLWGVTGIGYSQTNWPFDSPPASWDYLFSPERLGKYKGRISLLNDMREAIGAALIYKGHSPNSTDPKELEEAKQLLLQQKPYLAKYDSEAFEDSVASGEIVIAHGWSGEFFSAQAENPDIAFAVPKEGTFLFVDNLVVLRDSKNKDTAEVFINYLLRPEVNVRNADFLDYPTPNAAAQPLLDPKQPGASYQLPEDVPFYSVEDLGQAGKLYEQIWTEIKAQ